MGFWLFMLVSALLIPAMMLVFGRLFRTRPPQEINNLYGYRTARSMRNADTWRFAHVYCGRLWVRCGAIAAAVTALAFALLFGRGVQMIGFFGGGLVWAQTLLLVATVLPVERKLKNTFDEYGIYKEGRESNER